MANDHRSFVDLQGWYNTHGDWSAGSVEELRRRLQDADGRQRRPAL